MSVSTVVSSGDKSPDHKQSKARNSFGTSLANLWKGLEVHKEKFATIQAILTIAALFVGAIWTYKIFLEQRQNHPRLSIEYRIRHTKVSPDKILLSVTQVVNNNGPVLLKLREGTLRVIQVVPLAPVIADDLKRPRELPSGAAKSITDPDFWTVLAVDNQAWKENEFVMEPGEGDVVPYEFFIPADIKVVAIYSHLGNPSDQKGELGWNGITYYDLTVPAGNQIEKKAN